MPSLPFINGLRSMTLCGLICAGGGAVIFSLFPYIFAGIVGINTFMLFCGLLGGGLQNALTSTFNRFLPPVSRFIAYYEKLIELRMLGRSRIIPPDKLDELVRKLTDERFLGGISEGKKQLTS